MNIVQRKYWPVARGKDGLWSEWEVPFLLEVRGILPSARVLRSSSRYMRRDFDFFLGNAGLACVCMGVCVCVGPEHVSAWAPVGDRDDREELFFVSLETGLLSQRGSSGRQLGRGPADLRTPASFFRVCIWIAVPPGFLDPDRAWHFVLVKFKPEAVQTAPWGQVPSYAPWQGKLISKLAEVKEDF